MDSSTSKQVSRWILEFLVRNPENEDLAKRALTVLPVPNHEDADPRLKKAVLLRTIECELSDAILTESTLEALELIDDLDARLGVAAGDAIRAAYCAVSVECTARLLVGGGGRPGAKYMSALKRIWSGRVCRLGKKSRLSTSELVRWKGEVEAAVSDAGVREKLVALNTRNDAMASVRVYLKEAWALEGKSFIATAIRLRDEGEEEEIRAPGDGENPVCETSVSDVIELARKAGLDNLGGLGHGHGHGHGDDIVADDHGDDRVCDKAVALLDSPVDLVLDDELASNGKEEHGTEVMLQNKRVSPHRRRRGPVRISSDVDESDKETSGKICNSFPSPELENVQEALKSSSLELKRVVNDPLPGALQVSETVIDDLATENVICQEPLENESVREADTANTSAEASTEPLQSRDANLDDVIHHQSSENQTVREADSANMSLEKSTEPLQSRDANIGNPSCSEQDNVPRPSLMERNSTAHTQEWSDSIECSPEAKLTHRARLNLPSPKKRVVSPLKAYEPTKLSKRRKVKRWSLLEEDTLRNGVLKFGKGNWKLILNSNRDTFENRTEVDLKDKWRNMTR